MAVVVDEVRGTSSTAVVAATACVAAVVAISKARWQIQRVFHQELLFQRSNLPILHQCIL
jgi:hypothetical protein